MVFKKIKIISLSKKLLIGFFVFFLFFSLAGLVFAAQRTLELEYPEIGGIQLSLLSKDILPSYIKYIFYFSLALSGIIAFASLVFGGIKYLISSGNPGKVKDAKDQVKAAFLGLAVLFGSYLILTTINPQLTVLSVPGIIKGTIEKLPGTILPKDNKVLNYTEISVGDTIAAAFSTERIKRISNITNQIIKSKDIIDESGRAILDAMKSSSCDFCSQQCTGGSCEEGCGCECHGNPCSLYVEEFQELVFKITNEKEKIAAQIPAIKNEIEGYTDSGGKKIIGLKQSLEDLKKLKSEMISCPQNSSKNGKEQQLLTHNDFFAYVEFLQSNGFIEKTEGTKLIDTGSSTSFNPNSHLGSKFYCTEQFLNLSLNQNIGQQDIENSQKNIDTKINPTGQEQKLFCERESPIGQSIDSAEAILNQTIINFEKLYKDLLPDYVKKTSEFTGMLSFNCCLSKFNPDDIASCCSCGCTFIPVMCYTPCSCDCPEGEECNCECEPEAYCCGGSCAQTQKCNGTVFSPTLLAKAEGKFSESFQIGEMARALAEQVFNMYSSTKEQWLASISDAPNKNELVKIDPAPEVEKNLRTSESGLLGCFNKKADYLNFQNGDEILLKQIYTCSQIKQFSNYSIPVNFYLKDGVKITSCYGGDESENYFCCTPRIGQ